MAAVGTWTCLALLVFAAYLLGVFVVVAVGSALCALLARGAPMDAEQEKLFAVAPFALHRRALALLIESAWQALAFALQLVHELRLLPPPGKASDGRPVIVLPGYLENPGTMWLFAWRLGRAGFSPRVLDYPASGHAIERNARWLLEHVERLRAAHGGQRVLVVAHSMGGLVARTLLLAHPDHGIAALCALCSPFRGTYTAALGNAVGLRGSVCDMAPGSAYLQRFPAERSCDVPVLSLIGTQEDVVSPEWSAVLAGADNRVLAQPYGHITPLFAPSVFAQVERWLREQAPAA